jgi:type II secretory pathway pseudopilin PulG
MARSSPTGSRAAARGFAYVVLLIAVAVIAIAATASVSLGASMARRHAEQELLAIGLEFRQALHSYAGLPPGMAAPALARGPRSLDDLLRDPRAPGVRRHLRKLYADPLTGKAEWGLVTDPQGFIVGVHSLAEGEPIQRAGFDPRLLGFEDAAGYRQWVFGLQPAPAPLRP